MTFQSSNARVSVFLFTAILESSVIALECETYSGTTLAQRYVTAGISMELGVHFK